MKIINLLRGRTRAGAIAADSLTVGGVEVNGLIEGTIAVDPASIAAGAVGATAVTVTGVAAGDLVVLEPPSALDTGLVYIGHRVSANTITVLLFNPTGDAVNGASRTWAYKRIPA